MLISTQALVEVKVGVELGLRCHRFKLVAWFTTFSVCRVVVGGWVLKVRIRLSHLSTKMLLKLKLSLAIIPVSIYCSPDTKVLSQ